MNGSEVNHLLSPESNATQNEGRDRAYLDLKSQVFALAVHNLEARFLEEYNVDDDQYGFRPFPSGRFVDLIMEAGNFFNCDRSKKFLEVGCGPGIKLFLAHSFFEHVHGIEIDPAHVEAAQRLKLDVELKDALAYTEYGEYDLIYYYRPFADADKQADLERKICSEMKVGAFIAPMHTEIDFDALPDFQQVSRYLYLKRLDLN